MRASHWRSVRLFIIGLGTLALLTDLAWADETRQSITSPTHEHIGRVRSLHLGAQDLMEAEYYRQAIELYMEIVLLEPDDETAYANMGRAYMILGQYERAENAFLNALHINPENELAYFGIQKLRDPDRPLQAELD